MTKVKIEPGICGFTTTATATATDDTDLTVHVASGCPSIKGMMDTLECVSKSINLEKS